MPRSAKIVISGCGAVTEIYYSEALARLRSEGCAGVVGLFDPDRTRAAKLVQLFPGSVGVAEFNQLFDLKPDLMIVASPPAYHMAQVIASLKCGVSVLCEKPLAATLADGSFMAAAASSTGTLLAVGMVRRLFPATRAIKELLMSDVIGELHQIQIFEGDQFRWPVESPTYFQHPQCGGGVLLDIGVHVLDLLTWWLGDVEPLTCEDDAMGGIEANVRLTFRSKAALGEVRLSRDWYRPNQYAIRGSKGSIRWCPGQENELALSFDALGNYVVRYSSQTNSTFIGSLAQQIRNVVSAIQGEPASYVAGQDALIALRLIDDFYRRRSCASMPWLNERETAAAIAARIK